MLFYFFPLRLLVCLMFLLLILHLGIFKMCKLNNIYSKEKYNRLFHSECGHFGCGLQHLDWMLPVFFTLRVTWRRLAVYSQNVILWDEQLYFSFEVWFTTVVNLFYDLKIIWRLPRRIFYLWSMFSIINHLTPRSD